MILPCESDITKSMLSRRDFGLTALAAAPFARLHAARVDSKIHGVMVGAQSYSFRDMSVEDAVKAMKDIGLGYVELWQGHLEKGVEKNDLEKWMMSPDSLAKAKQVKKLFDDAGVQIYAYNCSFRRDWSDARSEAGMAMAKALGTKIITASSQVSAAAKLQPLAKKHGVVIAMHNHANLKDPEEYAKPESFEKAMQAGPNIAINLDIGHFTAANFDAVDYLKKQHKNIKTIHIKDRKKNDGANVPLGQGDTPIKEVLQLLKTNKWAIPAMIEYEYKGANTVEEVRKCFEYCKQALA